MSMGQREDPVERHIPLPAIEFFCFGLFFQKAESISSGISLHNNDVRAQMLS